MENKAELAESLFRSGANCAQAVLAAFAGECGITREQAFKLASGFGAGIARMREVCGAVSGMVMAADLLYGNADAADKEAKDAHYAFIRTLTDAFQQENGSVVCRELLSLGKNENTSPVSEARTEQYYRKRPCAELVKSAAAILEKAVKEKAAQS